MSLRTARQRKRRFFKKIMPYFMDEFQFLSKSAQEVVGLRELLCEYAESSCKGGMCLEYLEVVSVEGDAKGTIVRRLIPGKPKKNLGLYHVVKSKKGTFRFVEGTNGVEPISKTVKTARNTLFLMVIVPCVSLALFILGVLVRQG